MKMVNNGYVSRIPQDLEGNITQMQEDIEELQQGGSGGGGGMIVLTVSDSTLYEGTTPFTYNMLISGINSGKNYIYKEVDDLNDVDIYHALLWFDDETLNFYTGSASIVFETDGGDAPYTGDGK